MGIGNPIDVEPEPLPPGHVEMNIPIALPAGTSKVRVRAIVREAFGICRDMKVRCAVLHDVAPPELRDKMPDKIILTCRGPETHIALVSEELSLIRLENLPS